MSKLRSAIKSVVNSWGFDVRRARNSPHLTLCGIASRPINTIVDVGANNGQFSRYVLEFFPDAELYCFEPLPEPFESLKDWANAQSNNVHLFNLAIGEKAGVIDINLHSDHSPSSSILSTTALVEEYHPQTREQTRVTVDIDTLDNALVEVLPSLRQEILLKLDVQGYEDRVLRGAKYILHKTQVCIIEISLDNLYAAQADFYDLVNLLYGAGFRYAGNLDQSYADDGHVVYLDAVFKKP